MKEYPCVILQYDSPRDEWQIFLHMKEMRWILYQSDHSKEFMRCEAEITAECLGIPLYEV